jgi:hypothetical protein
MRLRLGPFPAVLAVAAVAAGAVTVADAQPNQPNQPVPARAEKNFRAARRDARKLLAKLVLPAGATVTARDPSVLRVLNSGGLTPASSALIDLHRFWLVSGEQPAAVSAWFQKHAPAGSSLTTTGTAGGPGYNISALGYSFPDISGVIDSRGLVVSITAARGGGTAIRADAQDVYWIPRPKWERVPAGVTQIGVTVQRLNVTNGQTTSTSQTVTDPKQVAKIISLVNALPGAQPWITACPIDAGPNVSLNFLSAAGAPPLATANAAGSGCDGVSFAIHGKQEPGLGNGSTLDQQLGRMLGFKG